MPCGVTKKKKKKLIEKKKKSLGPCGARKRDQGCFWTYLASCLHGWWKTQVKGLDWGRETGHRQGSKLGD